ncbi:hypothetical protein Tco_0773010 [Tanacetum coccineum]|uniref:Uncharacterized protein n=1 Tax=Tanacetum coccineum TaxID=301880 RepID=A0ABQ4ZJM9_9ASTR
MYVTVFGVDVSTTQSQPIESTQRTHRTISAPRLPNPESNEGESIKQNLQKVEEHLIAEEIENLVEGAENVENVEVNSSTVKQDDTQNIPGTRLEPMSDKESPEVEITAAEQPVNVIEGEEELAEDVVMDIAQKDKNKAKTDKNEHGNEKSVRKPKPKAKSS